MSPHKTTELISPKEKWLDDNKTSRDMQGSCWSFQGMIRVVSWRD